MFFFVLFFSGRRYKRRRTFNCWVNLEQRYIWVTQRRVVVVVVVLEWV